MSARAMLGVALALAASASGCPREEPAPPPEEVRLEPAPAPTPAAAPLIERSRPIMSTVFRIHVPATDEAVAEPAIRRAFDEIERLERTLSEWLPDSDISRINAAAGGDPVEVGPDALAVVQAGLEISRWSEGAFDMSWAALHGLYDFRPGSHRVPTADELRGKLSLIDYRQIAVDAEARTVSLRRRGMAIGTGGIAKGYALDRAGEILREAGIESYMLFGGGQVQVRGTRGDRPWRVGIQHPRNEAEYFGFVESTGGSISTSGDYEHAFFDDDGQRIHHILDLRTGLPARRSTSVTLLAPSGLYADALSTASFVLGPEAAMAMYARMPWRPEAVIVDDRCRIHTSPGLADGGFHLRMELVEGALPGCGP